MPNFDYINARLRGMKARLLDEDARRPLRQAEGVEGFLNALNDTSYADAVAQTRVEADGLRAAMGAIRLTLRDRIATIRRMFGGPTPVDPLLHRYDVQNVLAVLRGLAGGASKRRIQAMLLPAGDLSERALLRCVSEAEGWQAARDCLLSLTDLPDEAADALLRTDLDSIEAGLWHWYFSQEAAYDLVAEVLRRQADRYNIMQALRNRTDFVPTGHISRKRLREAAEAASVEEAVEVLRGPTTYRDALREGLHRYQQNGRLSAIEKALTDHTLRWRGKQIRRDPLGVGVLVGYTGLLAEEVRALRWIAQRKGMRV
jgi:V/A-type H+-transporting ATPase subunit C